MPRRFLPSPRALRLSTAGVVRENLSRLLPRCQCMAGHPPRTPAAALAGRLRPALGNARLGFCELRLPLAAPDAILRARDEPPQWAQPRPVSVVLVVVHVISQAPRESRAALLAGTARTALLPERRNARGSQKCEGRGQRQPHQTGQRGGCHRPRCRIFGLSVAFQLTGHREFHPRPRRGALGRACVTRLSCSSALTSWYASMEQPSVSGAAPSYAGRPAAGIAPALGERRRKHRRHVAGWRHHRHPRQPA